MIGVGNAESVAAVEAGGRTRVVLNLAQLVPYSVRTEGNTVLVTVEGTPAAIAADQTRSVTMPAGPGAGAASIQDIDFRRGAEGQAQVIVTLSDPSVGVNIQQQGENVVVDFANTALPEQLDRRLDVVDFATPAQEIDTFPFGNGTRMVIKPTGLFEHLAYQSDNLFTIELKPLTPEEEQALAEQRFGLLHRPQPGRERHRHGQRHLAAQERALGPGNGHHPPIQGPRHA
jgi:type IV pilus assembly protein PilQ